MRAGGKVSKMGRLISSGGGSIRTLTVIAVSVALVVGLAAFGTGIAGASSTRSAVNGTQSSGGKDDAIEIAVTGSAISDITSTPISLTPSFSPADTDYVWYCSQGTNDLNLELSSDGTIDSDGQSGSELSIPVSVVNNQAVVVLAPGGAQYWIRCLPSTFPRLSVTSTGTAAPGYYITGSFSTGRVPGYPMVLNSYGTPVWYLNNIPGSAQDTELLPGTHTIAWANSPAYRLYNLNSDTVTKLAPPIKPFDGHELFTDTSGNHWMISYPVRSGFNLSGIGFPKIHKIVDCAIQELNPKGHLIWSWIASDHVSPDEANDLAGDKTSPGAVDVYHCNSIDVNPLDSNQILVSMRQAGVFLIDKQSGSIVWKLGGTSVPPMGGEPVLKIVGDPEVAIQGQHDARFQPDGDISLYDDHTKLPGAARGIEYSIDEGDDEATMVWEYVAPSGHSTSVMGSVRIYDTNTMPYDEAGTGYLGPNETVIDWGHGAPYAGFTVLDDANDVLMTVEFPKGIVGNRTQKVSLGALDLSELRDSAGLSYP
jgi:hypothetical protein